MIGPTLKGLHATLRHPFRAIVIYDLDTDPTVEVVRAGATEWPAVELLKNSVGRGVLGALKTGFLAADTEYVAVCMADLSDDPEVINTMLEKADEGYDVVSASRYMHGGSQVGGPVLKSFLSRSAGQSLHLITRIPTHDATNAFRLYRRSFLQSVEIESTGGFEVTMELTIKAYLAGRPMAEVPASWRDRTAGTSKFNFRRWLPQYIRWYVYAVIHAPLGIRLGRGRQPRGEDGAERVSGNRRRDPAQKIKDFVTFPLRALTLFEDSRWGLSDLASERFDYVSREVIGYCLDVGCGRRNRLVTEYLAGNGKGVDVFRYQGLDEEQILDDPRHFPFADASFASVTFIANINHVPAPLRDAELGEAYRCLRPGGNIIVTMGNPVAEILVHRVVAWHDRLFDTSHDMDSERGMVEGEEYYLNDSEILERLRRAGFGGIRKKFFLTQWGLNHLFVGTKARIPSSR